MPAPDDLDRDKFYDSGDEDDGEEYELEPPDPAVLAAEQRRKEEVVAATRQSIDIDEVFREADRDHAGEILNEWVRNLRPQFQMKHVFIATAVLAILLALWQHEVLGKSLMMFGMISVICLYMYLQWKEQQYQAAAARRREAMYAKRRAAQTAIGANRPTSQAGKAAADRTSTTADDALEVELPPPRFEFRFSLQQLMLVVTGTAITLGLVVFLGGPSNASLMLGVLATAGLVFYAVGYEPPPIVVLIWWMMLLLYVVLGFAGMLWGSAG